jgi:hypothetical protein
MTLSWRRPRLLLSAVVAVGVLSGLTVAAAPAYAAGPHITVIGGPGEILVQGGGFNADATVRIEALTPDLSKTLDTVWVAADFFTRLADRRLGRGFADLDGTAEHPPSVVMTSVPDEQQPAGLVDGKHRDRREQEQVVSDGRPQPRDVRRDAHADEACPSA